MMMRSGLWAFAGKGGHQLINFVLLIVLARLLTPEAFGIVAVAQVILVISQVIVRFGFGAALIHSPRLTHSIERTALTLMLGSALLMVVIIYLATPTIVRLTNTPELSRIMPLMLLTFVFSAVANPSMSLLIRDMQFRLIAKIELLCLGLINGAVAVLLSYAGYSYWALVISSLVSTVAMASMVWSVRPILPLLSIQQSDLHVLIGFGGGVFFSQLAANVAQRVDNVVVASIFGPAALGLYSRAFSILDLTNSLLASVFHTVLFSGFSKKKRTGVISLDDAQNSFLAAHAFAAFLIMPISAASAILAQEIILILLGVQWQPSSGILGILSLGMYFRLAYEVSHAYNLANGHVYSDAWRLIFYAILVFIFASIGAGFGLTGVGCGVVMALIAVFLLLTQLSLSTLKLKVHKLACVITPFAVASILCGSVGFWISNYLRGNQFSDFATLLIALMLMLGTYFLLILLMRETQGVASLLQISRMTIKDWLAARKRDVF